MKIVRFLGGLGNQIFQYAFYLALKEQFRSVKADLHDFENYPLHNGFELERIFKVPLKKASKFEVSILDSNNRLFWSRKIRRLLQVRNAYQEEKTLFGYDVQLFEDRRSKLLWGYWQNINYVDRIEPQLRKILTFPEETNERNLNIQGLINAAEGKAVALHVRRGDYLKDPFLGGLANQLYYEDAIRTISKHIKDPVFFIFSDDIQWCRENLQLRKAHFIDWNNGNKSFRDMQLISLCDHAIIPNSSFSWWGAWLNDKPRKMIIAPETWYRPEFGTVPTKTMHPDNWILISNT